jgi:hypothetical protein
VLAATIIRAVLSVNFYTAQHPRRHTARRENLISHFLVCRLVTKEHVTILSAVRMIVVETVDTCKEVFSTAPLPPDKFHSRQSAQRFVLNTRPNTCVIEQVQTAAADVSRRVQKCSRPRESIPRKLIGHVTQSMSRHPVACFHEHLYEQFYVEFCL